MSGNSAGGWLDGEKEITAMSDHADNPFAASDTDRREIWDVLMRRDFAAFVAADWSAVADDFVSGNFWAMDAGRQASPDRWTLRFATVEAYRQEWLRQAREFQPVRLRGEGKLDFFYRAVRLAEIELAPEGDAALARKKFNGEAVAEDGTAIAIRWQTLYVMRKEGDRWKIAGFVGYLPYEHAADATGVAGNLTAGAGARA